MATVELELAMVLAAMARAIMHPESQRDATAATAATGKGITHREARLEGRFIVLARDRKVEPLPGSLLGRQSILVATTSHEINPLLALRANPASSNALAQLQRVQPGPTELGRDRMQPTGSDSTRKQNKDCVTGKAKRLDATDAKRNHHEHWRDRHHHDHDWWRHHCDAIVFVGGGFWGWYDGWWYPAWGYDPYYSYYDYNGPDLWVRWTSTRRGNCQRSGSVAAVRILSVRRLMECWVL